MQIDPNKPVWQLTVGEFLGLLEQQPKSEPETKVVPTERYVYGISGIAKLLDCSKTTACKIKQSGKIDKAVRQIGRKIIVDSELALQLLGKK